MPYERRFIREDQEQFHRQLERRAHDDDEVSEVSQYGDSQSTSSSSRNTKALELAIQEKETAELERDALDLELDEVIQMLNEEETLRKKVEQAAADDKLIHEQQVKVLKQRLEAEREENALSQAQISKWKGLYEGAERYMIRKGFKPEREEFEEYRRAQEETLTEEEKVRNREELNRKVRKHRFLAKFDEM